MTCIGLRQVLFGKYLLFNLFFLVFKTAPQKVLMYTFADGKCVREHLQLGEAAVAGAPNDP